MSQLFRRAYQGGGTLREFSEGGIAWTVMRWNVAGNCSAPVLVEILARPELRSERVIVATGKASATHRLELQTRCRKCENCLNARAAHWRLRALSEYRSAPRTWLCTLTFAPEYQFRALTIARMRIAKQGLDFDALSEIEAFRLRHNVLQIEVTKMFKRLRKEGAAFRYLLVAEEHKSGAPHYHMLVHEIVGRPLVRHAALKRQWKHGFLDAKLVADVRGAVYPCKYITKSVLARVRASQHYGDGIAALCRSKPIGRSVV